MEGRAHDISEKNKDSILEWDSTPLLLHFAAFPFCSENICVSELKGNGAISLAERILGQYIIKTLML